MTFLADRSEPSAAPSLARVLVASLLAATLMWSPAFSSLAATGFNDWPYFHHLWEAGYASVTRYGEWPLWDPTQCGGVTLFGNPQSPYFSPLYWLALPLGPTLASKVFVVLHATVGFASMYWLARVDHGISAAGATLASLAWGASGFFAGHVATGHAAFLPFCFAPLVLLLWRRAVGDARYAVWLACVLALVLYEGGVYPFPYFALLFAFAAAASVFASRELGPTLRAAALTLLLTALLGAIRLLPIVDELARQPRTMASVDGVRPLEVLSMLTLRYLPFDARTWGTSAHRYDWVEYGAYVGYGVLALGVLGFVACARRRRYAIVAGAAIFFALTLGDHGDASPWSLLHRLPIYDSLRVPSRFAVLFTLFVALAAGMGLDLLLRRLPRGRALVAWLVVLGIGVDLAVVHRPVIDRWHDPAIRSAPVALRFHYAEGLSYGRDFPSLPRLNLGTIECYEAMQIVVAPGLWQGDVAQARIADGRGEVHAWGRTTTRVWADVTLAEPARVLFNQNHAPGWQSDHGAVVAERGQLAIDVPAGKQRIEIVYRPPTLWPGIGAFALGVILCVVVLRRRVDRAARR
jgi:hypothetical protein